MLTLLTGSGYQAFILYSVFHRQEPREQNPTYSILRAYTTQQQQHIMQFETNGQTKGSTGHIQGLF